MDKILKVANALGGVLIGIGVLGLGTAATIEAVKRPKNTTGHRPYQQRQTSYPQQQRNYGSNTYYPNRDRGVREATPAAISEKPSSEKQEKEEKRKSA